MPKYSHLSAFSLDMLVSDVSLDGGVCISGCTSMHSVCRVLFHFIPEATLVMNANHMYLNGFRNVGLSFHYFNVFQIIRLLATRGHYSIDIIIGWYMAVYVSHPAGRLGRHFSRGDKSMKDLFEKVYDQSAL